MLSIIMECRDNEAALAQTLSALVPGAVEGIVREVVVLDCGSRDGSAKVADAAGCRFLAEWDLREVVRSVRGDWLLLLEPGARPLAGWMDAVIDHVAIEGRPARFSPARGHRLPLFRRRSPLERGFLVRAAQALATIESGGTLAGVAQAGRVRTLAAGIIPAAAMRAMRGA